MGGGAETQHCPKLAENVKKVQIYFKNMEKMVQSRLQSSEDSTSITVSNVVTSHIFVCSYAKLRKKMTKNLGNLGESNRMRKNEEICSPLAHPRLRVWPCP